MAFSVSSPFSVSNGILTTGGVTFRGLTGGTAVGAAESGGVRLSGSSSSAPSSVSDLSFECRRLLCVSNPNSDSHLSLKGLTLEFVT